MIAFFCRNDAEHRWERGLIDGSVVYLTDREVIAATDAKKLLREFAGPWADRLSGAESEKGNQ